MNSRMREAEVREWVAIVGSRIELALLYYCRYPGLPGPWQALLTRCYSL